MATKKPTNQELIKAMSTEMSTETRERIEALGDNSPSQANVYALLTQYPTALNEFINTLTNKVYRTSFFSKIWLNKLREFHKGKLDYGVSIEQLFVEMAERKGFYDTTHYSGSTTDEGDLIGKTVPPVQAMYITRNFAWQYKVSISDQQLRGAFTSQSGLSDLMAQLSNSALRSAYYDEYNMMKGILTRTGAELKTDPLFANDVSANGTPNWVNPTTSSKGVIARIAETSTTTVIPKQIEVLNFGADEEKNAKILTKAIRRDVENFGFVKSDYNLANVMNFSNPEDLIFITTPSMKAELDVEVLANAFNIDKVDLTTRLITVDELPNLASDVENVSLQGAKVLGILMDKEIMQQWETENSSEAFRNPQKMMTNVFFNRHGISATCDFANCKVYVQTVTP